MANMSYCRFQNTLNDLKDCYNSDDMWDDSELSEEEKKARIRLIQLCYTIGTELDHGDDDD